MREFLRFGLSGTVSGDAMRAIDKNADAYGITPGQRMEAAGTVLAQNIAAQNPEKVLLLCGAGNNGGDGFVAARHLANRTDVSVISCGTPKTPEATSAYSALKSTCAEVYSVASAGNVEANLPAHLFDADIIADCLLGTGAKPPLKEPHASLVRLMNESNAEIYSCDMPTPGARSNRIIAFHLAKNPGAEVFDIGIPLAAEVFCGEGDILIIPQKKPDSHKGAGGTVLVVGGGPYQGAPFLSGIAALRAGADIVRVAAPVDGFVPDIIHERLPGNKICEEHLDKLLSFAERSDVTLCGPGLGADKSSLLVASQVVSASRKAVVDADLLRNPLPTAREDTLYTPHAGEFERCFGAPPKDIVGRGVFVKEAAMKSGATVLLKGKTDVISDGSRVKFNQSGAKSMTVGGTGDILAGTCAGLLAKTGSFEAACAAVYAVCKAGELCDSDVGEGLIATDLPKHTAHILYGE